eukprot:377976-Prymnesium_polylepis.2
MFRGCTLAKSGSLRARVHKVCKTRSRCLRARSLVYWGGQRGLRGGLGSTALAGPRARICNLAISRPFLSWRLRGACLVTSPIY